MILSAHLPVHGIGQKIGIYGGSFNPPHLGHRHAAISALTKLQLDAVWVLVSPQNPLKAAQNVPVEERVAATQKIMNHPKIHVLNIESEMNSIFTYDIMQSLQNQCRTLNFVYIMGADSFCDVHRWHKWQNIMRTVPICVVDRPLYTHKAMCSRAALQFANARVAENYANKLAHLNAPAWVFLHGKLNGLSSTKIRNSRLKK